MTRSSIQQRLLSIPSPIREDERMLLRDFFCCTQEGVPPHPPPPTHRAGCCCAVTKVLAPSTSSFVESSVRLLRCITARQRSAGEGSDRTAAGATCCGAALAQAQVSVAAAVKRTASCSLSLERTRTLGPCLFVQRFLTCSLGPPLWQDQLSKTFSRSTMSSVFSPVFSAWC